MTFSENELSDFNKNVTYHKKAVSTYIAANISIPHGIQRCSFVVYLHLTTHNPDPIQ